MVISIITIKAGDGTGRRPADVYDPLGTMRLCVSMRVWWDSKPESSGDRLAVHIKHSCIMVSGDLYIQKKEKFKTSNIISCNMKLNLVLIYSC